MTLPPDVVAAKNALRATQRQRLACLAPEERAERSRSLVTGLSASPSWQAARRVLLFAPLSGEPDLDLLWSEGCLAGKECAYPRVDGKTLSLLRVYDLADLRPARWGLREPPVEGSTIYGLDEFDLVLVPGLAFAANGGRLGRGGGFYDRLLADKHASTLSLGLAFAFQIVPELPLAPHDVIMDAVVTD